MQDLVRNSVKNRNYYLYFYLTIVLLIFISAYIYTFDREEWSDERHFVSTIHYFSETDFFESIGDYPEVTPPLFYITYQVWGNAFGFELSALRLLSIITGITSSILLFYLYHLIFNNFKLVFWLSLLTIINPYFIGTNVFIYTDSMGFLFIILFLISILKDNSFLMVFAATLALLTRQYYIFIIIAAAIFYLLNYLSFHDKSKINKITLLLASTFPLILLFFLWGGISPKTGLLVWTLPSGFVKFNASNLVTYLVFLVIYSLPLIIIYAKSLLNAIIYNKKTLFIGLLVSSIYFLFPVEVSKITSVQTNLDTVGLVHRFLKKILDNNTLEHLLFYLFFIFAVQIFFQFIRKMKENFVHKNYDNTFFLQISLMLFMIIMPFSYQVWEKYLLPIIPVFAILIIKFTESIKKMPH